ncbi:MAG: hypothetical protein NVSMB21_06780 [Vulcanimicrobiaceae bacterium]
MPVGDSPLPLGAACGGARARHVIVAIVAGGAPDDPFARSLGVSVKALAVVDGTTLLARAIAAARGSGATRIAVIGNDDVRRACEADVDRVVPEGPDGRANIERALGSSADRALLLMTSDLPFVSAVALDAFLRRARAHEVALPLAEDEAYRAAYPGAPRHVTRVGRERVANGSVAYFAPGVAPRALEAAGRLFAARSSPVRLAALLGPARLARFALGRLRIEHLEALATSFLGRDVRAIRGSPPELCFDIDTATELAYARAFAARR